MKPFDLLGALLLGNLIANTLFFAAASVVVLKIEHHVGVIAAAVVAPATFLCLVLFGEILPKSISYANPERVCVRAALPTAIMVRALAPVVTMFRWLVAEPALRLLLGVERKYQSVTLDEFKALIEATRERGLIGDRQAHLFAEVLTFNLFRADTLMPMVSPILFGVYEPLRRCGAIRVLQLVFSLFARLSGTSSPSKRAIESLHRREIAAILKDTEDEGFLSGIQTGIMNRVVIASTVPVKAVMTRFQLAQKVEVNCNRDLLRSMLEHHNFTRMLVYRGEPANILGFVNVYEAMVFGKSFDCLEPFVNSLESIDADTPVTDAIDRMQRDKLKILLVSHSQGHKPDRPVGIITMKDLTEELLCELVVS